MLQFRWQEPNDPPLTGEGFLVFDLQGRQYSGRWWSDKRDRVGDWNGWRQARAPQSDQFGGQGYGDDLQQAPQPQQRQVPYRRQQPYQPQPYQPQPQQPQQPPQRWN